jgi:TonB family protein
MAWINSICLAYLLIGVAGLKPQASAVRTLQPLEMPVIAPLETEQTQTQAEDQEEEQADTPPEATKALLVVAVWESPELVFPVPSVPDLVAPLGRSQAPPLNPMQQRVQQASNPTVRIRLTDGNGNFPEPDYPSHLRQARMTGTIMLLISVDAAGVITAVDVKQSSGHSGLDTHAINHVRRRFTFPAADGPRVYESSMGFVLR